MIINNNMTNSLSFGMETTPMSLNLVY